MITNLSDFGAAVSVAFWVPVLAWSLCAYLVARVLANDRYQVGADVRYVASVALLVGLPLGFAAGQLFGGLAPVPTYAAIEAPELRVDDTVGHVGSQAERATEINSVIEFGRPVGTTKDRESGSSAIYQPWSGATRSSMNTTVPAVADGSTRLSPALRSLYALVGFATCILFLYAALLAGRLVAQLARVRRLRTLPEVDDAAALSAFHRVRSRVVRRRAVRLHVGPDTLAPMTFGLLRPIVVVPSTLLQDASGLEVAFAHELQHVRRNDYAVGLMLRLLTLPVAWHPLIRNLLREMEDARESLCDYRVIGEGGVTLQVYATTLLHFAANRPQKHFHPALAAPSGQLKKRIEAMRQIMNDRTPVRIRRRALPALMGTLLLGLALFATACSSPPASNQATTVSSEGGDFTDLPSLELQVEYLIQEIQRLEKESDDMLATVEGNEERFELRQTIAWSVLSQRKLLLGQVLSEKLRERELARMEAAVGLTVRG